MPNPVHAKMTSWPEGWLCPDLGAGVGALMTARPGGVSQGAYQGCNLGHHVGDDPQAVSANREQVALLTGGRPVWLDQVHGAEVLRLPSVAPQPSGEGAPVGAPQADGALSTEPGVVCTAMVADCLPLLLAAPEGRGVAALHAGWRGLAGAGAMRGRGIVEAGVEALCEATGADPQDIRVWLGPCIGPSAFEVGADVLQGFGADPSRPHPRFVSLGQEPVGRSALAESSPKWLADLPGLARDRLQALGLPATAITGGEWCTFSTPSRFFSFRRDRVTGRQAACIWVRPR